MLICQPRNDTAMMEHLDPNSYSWCLMRYSIVKYIHHSLRTFLPHIGIELPGEWIVLLTLQVCSNWPISCHHINFDQLWGIMVYAPVLFS